MHLYNQIEVDKVIRSVDLSKFIRPIFISNSRRIVPDDCLSVTVSISVVHRDNGAGISINGCIMFKLPILRLQLIYELRKAAHNLVTHEIDECFMVDGQRMFDPHGEFNLAK
jgi:hypothetical protein